MTDFEIKIERTKNGYVVEWWEENDEGDQEKDLFAFEEEDDETGELDCLCRMLWFVAEHFGQYRSKHNRYNLNIEVVKNADLGA